MNHLVYKGGTWKFLIHKVLLSPVHSLDHSTGFVFLKLPAGFWQYGTLQWDEFYRYLTEFVVPEADWRIFRYDTTQQSTGALCPSNASIVQPGHYIILSPGENQRLLPASLLFCISWTTYSRRPGAQSAAPSYSHTPQYSNRVSQSWTTLKICGVV